MVWEKMDILVSVRRKGKKQDKVPLQMFIRIFITAESRCGRLKDTAQLCACVCKQASDCFVPLQYPMSTGATLLPGESWPLSLRASDV